MALTYTETWQTVVGDRLMGYGMLTHDASDTAVDLPCDTIDFAQILYLVGTNATATTCTFSGNTITVSAAGVNATTNYILWMGV